MDLSLDELKRLTSACRKAAEAQQSGTLASACQSLRQAIESIHEAWSGSFIGYQALIYLDGFKPREAGENYDIEWGSITGRLNKTRGVWRQYSKQEVEEAILSHSHGVDLAKIEQAANLAREAFERCKEELLPILDACMGNEDSSVLSEIRKEVTALESFTPKAQFRAELMPSGALWSRDSTALAQGIQAPPHLERLAWLLEKESCFQQCGKLASISERTMRYLKRRDLLNVGTKRRRVSDKKAKGRNEPFQDSTDSSSHMPTKWELLVVGGLLAFLVGVLGNLVAAWIQQEMFRNAFTPLRVAIILALTVAGLLATAWVDKTRQGSAGQAFGKRASKQPGPTREQRSAQPAPFVQSALSPSSVTSPSKIQPGSILIVTATKTEAQAVLETLSQSAEKRWARQAIGNKTYYDLGIHGGAPVYMVQSEPGTAVPGGALVTVRQAIQDLSPQAVIMCGFAFGLRPDKQQLGDILVAKQLLSYEPQKVDLQQGQMPRGDRTTSAERLLDRFRSGDNDWQGAPTHFGLVVSGEKLVNDPAFRDWLLKTEPEAIGGEMEGAGLYVAARDAKIDWILVKAICDWGDGKKNDAAQSLAARNAAQFVLHVLQLGGWDGPEQLRQQSGGGDVIEQRMSISSEQTGNVTVIGKIVAVSQAIDERIFRRLGLQQRIGFILLALLIMMVGVGGSLLVYFAVCPPPPPMRMSGDFRIAVAAFTEHESPGDSETGMRFAEDLHTRLADTFQDLDPGLEITVWGPHQVARTRGQTEEDRAETAAQIAEKIEADVLVYGWVETTGSVWKIAPEFYIRARNSYEIAEIAGQYSIGTPIDVVGGREFGSRDYANRKLLARTQAIANITAGLTYYNAGYLDKQNFQRALIYFQMAEKVEGWEPWEGKQVLYVLVGNAYGEAGDFQLAETYHRKALVADPEYARALVGLAGVYYMRALEPTKENNIPGNTDLEFLDLSISTYKQAAQSTNQPPLAEIPSKVHFGLGQCYFARGYARAYLEREGIHTQDLYAKSFDEFEAAVEEYESRNESDKVRLRVIAAESHARLGLIHALLAELQPACDEYEAAISLWYDNPQKQADYDQMMQNLQVCEHEGS